MRMLRWLVGLVLVVGIAATCFAAVANYRADGAFSLRVFDPAWWSVGSREAQPYVDGATEAAKEAYAAVWNEGGLVDQAQAWLKDVRQRREEPGKPALRGRTDEPEAAQPAKQPAGTPAPAAPQQPAVSKATAQLEERLASAEAIFEQGVSHYHAGNPTQGGFTDAKKKELAQAKRCFQEVRDILADHLDRYESMSDHDPQRAADARRMQQYNQQLLFNAGKMGGGL